MISKQKWTLAMVAALGGLAVSGCKLTDITDDDDEDSTTAAVLLQGTVTTANGDAALGATVNIKDANGNSKRLTTDNDGNFTWKDEFDEDDDDAHHPFFGLQAPVVVLATLNGEMNAEYYSVLCNTVFSSGNRVNASALTHYTLEQTAPISADLFENWDNPELNFQNSYCNQAFADELTGIAGTMGGFNFFNSPIPSPLPTEVQDGLDALSDNGTIAIGEQLSDVQDSLGSFHAGYPVQWTLTYEGTIDGEPRSGEEAYAMDQAITIQQLKNKILELVDAESAQVNSLNIKELAGTRLGDEGTEITASLSGTVDALGLSKDFDLELHFSASAFDY